MYEKRKKKRPAGLGKTCVSKKGGGRKRRGKKVFLRGKEDP